MTANRIIHHIFNQPDLRQVDQASLEQLVEKYPYFAAARMLLARKDFTGNKDLTAPLLKMAQLYSNTPQQVHQFVTAVFTEPVADAPAETAITSEDQIILDELAAEDERNREDAERAALEAAKAAEQVEEKYTQAAAVVEETVTGPQAIEEEVSDSPAIAEEDVHLQFATRQKTPSPQVAVGEGDLAPADETITTAHHHNGADTPAQPARPEPDAEDLAIAAKYDEFLYEDKTPATPAPLAPAADEVVAIDYEAEQDKADFEAARTQSEPDEIIAIDYEAEQDKADFETARTQSAPDEIIAIDYEAEQDKADFEAARTQSAPDEIIAIDYAAIREEYEPEPEDEDIVVTTTGPEGAGITLPAAPAAEAQETGEAAAEAETPIRIHPMDTPEEETVLTFQPLYTEDYFAYKKLKDPNSAETMNDKAAAEMRSFTDWLRELKDNFAGKSAKDWYHQQLNRLYEDDEPEVSERVEKMAMASITLNDDIVSETLAEIWVRQHQHGKAIAVYQKLSLLNPDKNAYFAQKIKDLQLLTDNNK